MGSIIPNETGPASGPENVSRDAIADIPAVKLFGSLAVMVDFRQL
jgi:hypothetical protein